MQDSTGAVPRQGWEKVLPEINRTLRIFRYEEKDTKKDQAPGTG
jgi:hypothetical protein